MFLRKYAPLCRMFKFQMKFSTPLFKAFSGGHGHGHDDHGDGHGHEEVHVQSHKPKYDRVAYNTQLKSGEREP